MLRTSIDLSSVGRRREGPCGVCSRTAAGAVLCLARARLAMSRQVQQRFLGATAMRRTSKDPSARH
eukprot:11814909-Alexandrium_andersonii.AAC.1